MATSAVKRQHFVPRLYLNYFVNQDGCLFAYDKVNDRTFNTKVDGVANEVFFYDFPQSEAAASGREPRDQAVETLLAEMDEKFAEALRRLHKDIATGSISIAAKKLMIPCIAIQMLRTRETRDYVVQFNRVFQQSILKAYKDDAELYASAKEFIGKAAVEPSAVAHARMMFSPEIMNMVCSTLYEHIWQIFHNGTSTPLYTSDHPLARHAHLNDRLQSTSGINSPGVELIFPLSPTLLLSMAHRESFKTFERAENTVVEMKEENVVFYNDVQVSESYRQVYCCRDDFTLAAEICRDRPYLRDPKRARVGVNLLPATDR